MCGYTSPSRWPYDHFLHVSRTAASLSVEGSRLARRPPRKRRVAAFTPRSETTIGTGLNSSKRDDIQTMDRHVFRVVVLRRNGTENRVKQMAHFVPNRCRSISRVWAARQRTIFPFRDLARGSGWSLRCNAKVFRPFLFSETGRRLFIRSKD